MPIYAYRRAYSQKASHLRGEFYKWKRLSVADKDFEQKGIQIQQVCQKSKKGTQSKEKD